MSDSSIVKLWCARWAYGAEVRVGCADFKRTASTYSRVGDWVSDDWSFLVTDRRVDRERVDKAVVARDCTSATPSHAIALSRDAAVDALRVAIIGHAERLRAKAEEADAVADLCGSMLTGGEG